MVRITIPGAKNMEMFVCKHSYIYVDYIPVFHTWNRGGIQKNLIELNPSFIPERWSKFF